MERGQLGSYWLERAILTLVAFIAFIAFIALRELRWLETPLDIASIIIYQYHDIIMICEVKSLLMSDLIKSFTVRKRYNSGAISRKRYSISSI